MPAAIHLKFVIGWISLHILNHDLFPYAYIFIRDEMDHQQMRILKFNKLHCATLIVCFPFFIVQLENKKR